MTAAWILPALLLMQSPTVETPAAPTPEGATAQEPSSPGEPTAQPTAQEPEAPPAAPGPASPGPVVPDPGQAPAGSPAPTPELPPLQGPDPTSSTGPRPEWQLLNGVNLIINEEPLTASDIQRAVLLNRRPVNSEREQVEQANETMQMLIEAHLKSQAGQDMGFDPSMIQRFVTDEVDRRMKTAGSAGRLAETFRDSNLDAVSYHQDIESRVLRDLWTGAVTGEYPGVGGRPFRDRYVRPSRLKFEFERQDGGLDLPTKVVLQEMLFQPEASGSLEASRKLAVDVLAQVRDGGDFGELAVAHGAARSENQGVNRPLEEERLLAIPDIGEFVVDAQPGDVSEVLAVRDGGGELRAWRVLKLLERQSASVARFEDPKLQGELRERYLEGLDRKRENQALNQLLDAAYVWPPSLFGRAEERAATPAPAAAEASR